MSQGTRRLLVFAFLFSLTPAWTQQNFFPILGGQRVGTSVFTFLKIGVGSRAEAMGGAYVSQVNDISALYWNPAGLTGLAGPQVMFSQTNWLTGINHIFVGIGWPVSAKFGTVGLSVISLSMEDLEETTQAEPDGTGRTFPAGDIAIGVGYARKISNRFSVGLQGKFIQETISFSKASSIAIDVGTLYDTGFMGIKVGMAVTNFGPEMTIRGSDLIFKKTDPFPDIGGNPNVNSRLETQDWPLPVSTRIGISWDPFGPNGAFKTNALSLTMSTDYYDPRDFQPYYNLGLEAGIMNMFYIRGGIVNRFSGEFEFNEEDGVMDLKDVSGFLDGYEQLLSLGLGLEQKIPFSNIMVSIDYAFSEMPYFKGVQRLTISMKF